MKKEYNDNIITVVADTEENIGFYADMWQGFEVFSVNVAQYIIRKLQENEKQGYKLLDYIKIINNKR